MKHQYIRVGTMYYKKVMVPLISGDKVEKLIPWTGECIKLDHGKHVLANVPRYDGFCHLPSHTDYQPTTNNFLNRYEPITHKPKEGNCENTIQFLNHIFGEQIDIGLDYLTLLYKEPLQPLPVLCLVSKERETGKTTFLNWLKAIYQNNMTYNKNEDFRSQFNSDWASKLIIAVDEVLLDKVEDSERIKNLSTAKTFKTEAKGKDRSETEFFGKFILCSNNEDSFIQIEPGETRYWVRQIRPIQNVNIKMLDKLIEEIPSFLHHIITRKMATTNQTRMWFTANQLQTDALRRVMRRSRNWLEVEMMEILTGLMEDFELESISFCVNDLIPILSKSGFKISRQAILKVLRDDWQLAPMTNAFPYTRYMILSDGTMVTGESKGRYYNITRSNLPGL